MIRLPPGSTRTATLFPYTTRVRSITYLLHCLPGPSSRKAVAFANLKPLLNDGARVFGATILGRGVRHHALGRQVLRLYNARGIFGHAEDDLAGLRDALTAHSPDAIGRASCGERVCQSVSISVVAV